jgi:aminoglycoside phosphotransferase (APT) family kinase protein
MENILDISDPEFSELRHKWIDQVSHTPETCHSHCVVWGNTKAANLIIDVNDDASLMDF